MTNLKKIWKFISSMRFAILLLAVLALACSVGSMVTQGQSFAWYAQRYSERTAALILALHLDDAFHSWWFLLISAFLCINLLLCNILRLPQLIRQYKAETSPASVLSGKGDVSSDGITDPETVFCRLRMPAPISCRTDDGRNALFSVKNPVGLWGAWICHLGILLLIAGFTLGQTTQQQFTVYGVPGQTRPIGDTGLLLTIDAFDVALRPDDTVEQYTASLTVHSTKDGSSRSASASVNHPASLYGMKFYQNSTGWAETVTVMQDGQFLQQQILCTGETLPVENKPDLIIDFTAFYPDLVMEAGSMPRTATGSLNNPATLYTVYYQDQILGMNILMSEEELTIDEYTVTFSDPQMYTLIQIKRDVFTPLAFAGGLITMLGLFCSFYLQTEKLWAVEVSPGSWAVSGCSRKGGILFREKFLWAVS